MVWHTHGLGKSLTMAFYAGRLILHPAMENPTIVAITARCHDLLRCDPEQARAARICAQSCAAVQVAQGYRGELW